MTGNIKPENNYSHAEAMRMREAMVKSCGTEFDPLFLVCMYLQMAIDKETFSAMIDVLEMSETQLEKMFGLS